MAKRWRRYRVEGRGKDKRLTWVHEDDGDMGVTHDSMPTVVELIQAARKEFPGIPSSQLRVTGRSTFCGVTMFIYGSSGVI